MLKNSQNLPSGPWGAFLARFPDQLAQIPTLEARIKYSFRRRDYLYEALSHRSAVSAYTGSHPTKQKEGIAWNERIEFLGDSVLGLIISTELWQRNQDFQEGQLSKLRSHLVNEEQLSKIAQSIDLGLCLILGKGEEKNGGRTRPALLADALEGLIGAVYLDGGFSAAQIVVKTLYSPILSEELIKLDDMDYKSRLQEWSQERVQAIPTYHLEEQRGPDHAREFLISVHLAGKFLAQARANTKKRASQIAAKLAFEKIRDNGLI